MTTYANIAPNPITNGVVYAANVPLTSTEADLYTSTQTQVDGLHPIPIVAGQGIQAVVQIVVTGAPVGNLTYIVMQTDMGGGVWVDVAWIVSTERQAPSTFVMSVGNPGNNVFQQVRQAGSPPTPQTNGQNAMVLGNRIRFVGKASLTGGSSGTPGSFLGVKATVTYRLLDLR